MDRCSVEGYKHFLIPLCRPYAHPSFFTMGLPDREIISIVQLIVYFPILLVSGFVTFRHGLRRDLGWIYLNIFSIGASLFSLSNFTMLTLCPLPISSYRWCNPLHYHRDRIAPFDWPSNSSSHHPERCFVSFDACNCRFSRCSVSIVSLTMLRAKLTNLPLQCTGSRSRNKPLSI
jgi:hypothetical protein